MIPVCLFQLRICWDSSSLILLHYPWFFSLLTSSQRCHWAQEHCASSPGTRAVQILAPGWLHVPTGAAPGQLCPSCCVQSWRGHVFLLIAGSTFPGCPSVPLATRLLHHALGATPGPVCPACWWCSWPLEIPTGFFYPLEEGLACCSWSCQPLWCEVQASVVPPLSFPSSDNSPVPLTGALQSWSCQHQSHSPQQLQ